MAREVRLSRAHLILRHIVEIGNWGGHILTINVGWAGGMRSSELCQNQRLFEIQGIGNPLVLWKWQVAWSSEIGSAIDVDAPRIEVRELFGSFALDDNGPLVPWGEIIDRGSDKKGIFSLRTPRSMGCVEQFAVILPKLVVVLLPAEDLIANTVSENCWMANGAANQLRIIL